MNNLSIDFYEEAQGAVIITWPPDTMQANDPDARSFSDALLFACYTLRQMRNLGRHPDTDALALELMHWTPPLIAGTQTDTG